MSKTAKAEKRRAKKSRHGRAASTEPLDPWPDTTGLSEEDAARVIGEFLYWEDYADRNPDSSFAAPM